MEPLEIDVEADDGRHVVTPRGEVDLVTQSRLREVVNELVAAGHVDVVVDLEETTFLDSTGLGALIGARRTIHAVQGSFSLVCTQERLLKLFRITSLDKILPIHPSRAAALAADRERDASVDLPEGQLTQS